MKKKFTKKLKTFKIKILKVDWCGLKSCFNYKQTKWVLRIY